MNGILTPQDVADKLKLNVQYVRRLLQNGKLKGFKVGNDWRVLEQEIENFINRASAGVDILHGASHKCQAVR